MIALSLWCLVATSDAQSAAYADQIRAHNAALVAMRSNDDQALEVLAALDQAIAGLEALRRLREQEAGAAATQREEIMAASGNDDRELAQLENQLQARLRSLYVDGGGGAARALVGAESFADLAIRQRVVSSLAANDARLWRSLDAIRNRRAQAVEQLLEVENRARAAAQAAADHEVLVRQARDERTAVLLRLRAEQSSLLRVRSDLVAREAALRGLLRPSLRPTTSGFARNSLRWPAAGTVTTTFGPYVDDADADQMRNGIDIRANFGSTIVAVADGTVAHVGRMRGLGQVVIIDHGNGFHSLHAHVGGASVVAKQPVLAGEPIATVGESESFEGAKLYFELRRNGRPVDPMRYLTAR